ncbi:MAG: hypothetical protein ACRDGU_05950 [Actinomycetota bacterium]
MTSRTAGRLAWSAWALTVVLAGLSFVLIGLSETTGDPARFGPQGFDGALSLLFGTVGALIASRRPDNVIGWLFLGMGLVGGIGSAGTEYGTYAYYEGHGSRALGHAKRPDVGP